MIEVVAHGLIQVHHQLALDVKHCGIGEHVHRVDSRALQLRPLSVRELSLAGSVSQICLRGFV
jgi:hypothetical protein